MLLYGKAGGGWVGSNNLTVTNLTTGASFTCGSFLNNCGNNNNGGWLVGAGFEYAFTNNWTVKAEYDYLGLGNRTFAVPATAPFLAGDTFTSNNRNVQMVKIGVQLSVQLGRTGHQILIAEFTFDPADHRAPVSNRSPFFAAQNPMPFPVIAMSD